jgi:Beta-ketoacyl synthase, C-terminal domain
MWTRLVVMKSVVEAPTFCYRCDRAIVFRIETHAKKREAKVYAELLGYSVSSDAEHISEPDPTGQHPARAIKMAFADAGINPEEIDYINAHGTTTALGDASFTRARIPQHEPGCASDEPQAPQRLRVRHDSRGAFWRKRDMLRLWETAIRPVAARFRSGFCLRSRVGSVRASSQC